MTFATGTDLYARHVGRYTDALAAAFVEWAGVRAGDEALDVGCGPGSVVAALADRLGPAHVAAVEPSEPFAALARERVPGVDIARRAPRRCRFRTALSTWCSRSWAPFTSGLAPSGAYCASLPPDAQRDLRNACFRRLGRPAGAFELDARARLVEGSV